MALEVCFMAKVPHHRPRSRPLGCDSDWLISRLKTRELENGYQELSKRGEEA